MKLISVYATLTFSVAAFAQEFNNNTRKGSLLARRLRLRSYRRSVPTYSFAKEDDDYYETISNDVDPVTAANSKNKINTYEKYLIDEIFGYEFGGGSFSVNYYDADELDKIKARSKGKASGHSKSKASKKGGYPEGQRAPKGKGTNSGSNGERIEEP